MQSLSLKERTKQLLNWQVPAVCFGFYAVWTALFFLFSNIGHLPFLGGFMLVILCLFSPAYAIFGCIKNKSMIFTTLIYFLFNIILYLIITGLNSSDIDIGIRKTLWLSVIILTLICAAVAGITKLVIVIKTKQDEE